MFSKCVEKLSDNRRYSMQEAASLYGTTTCGHRRSAREVPPTEAERITRFLQSKYTERYETDDPPEPFDWTATLERVRRMIIERGGDPDERY